MADFLPAFEKVLINEGGYLLHTIEGDRGGMTYAGIARNMNPGWAGWAIIDAGGTPQADLVRGFYRSKFWDVLRLDQVKDQSVAMTVFDFAVNAGVGTSAKLTQIVAGVTPDGSFGPKTLEALNAVNPDLFMARFALAKLSRYEQIVTRDRTQGKFLLGWLRRTLKEAAA